MQPMTRDNGYDKLKDQKEEKKKNVLMASSKFKFAK